MAEKDNMKVNTSPVADVETGTGEDVEAIKKATEELAQASHKLAEQLYSQAQGQQPGADAAGAAGAQPGAGAAGGKKADDDVIDADFTESK